ncbi:MAG: STM4012 family radical SAM protein [Cyanobacteria bacterium]|nr:STM4012 family radical SAM protein [Cyanobacteriota bacterium]
MNLMYTDISKPTENAYLAYSYSYPHKTAYRTLTPAVTVADAWEKEKRDALFLYFHVPFCEMRCGFCNLFTIVSQSQPLEELFVNTLEKQAQVVSEGLGDCNFARMAIGGGTPTHLEARQLERLFQLAARSFSLDVSTTPISVETSPLTAQPDKLQVMRSFSVDRVSIGVQSFLDDEVRAVGRSQNEKDVLKALTRIKGEEFPILNIDLIYGLPGQTRSSFLHSIKKAVIFAPEEIYLYPLYVRPLTGIARHNNEAPDNRLELYQAGRDVLLENGYRQISMRMFQSQSVPEQSDAPLYCCQTDGMVGLGSGARSYTSALHYSTKYAVNAKQIKSLINDYIGTEHDQFGSINHGYYLDETDQRRRHVIQSILNVEGLTIDSYEKRFGAHPCQHIPLLNDLIAEGLLEHSGNRLLPTERGLELSDSIGVRLYSEKVSALMMDYEPK